MSLRKNYFSTRWILLIGSVILIFSCSLFEGSEDGGRSPGDLPDPSPTPTPTPIISGDPGPDEEPPPLGDACPEGAANFGLQANHNFWTPTGMGDWVWQAAGLLSVALDDQGAVSNTGPQIIPGSQSGAFSQGSTSCSFEAPAEVFITISGVCSESVLRLEICEDWQMGTYDWVCDDDAFSFDLPDMGMPPAQHQVEYDLRTPETYTFEIPFGGGDGTKTYSLIQ